MNELQISLNIAGRQYPLKVQEGEEEMIRRAEEKINGIISELEKNYAINDKHDLLAMCLIKVASDLEKKQLYIENMEQEVSKQTERLMNNITAHLNKNNVL